MQSCGGTLLILVGWSLLAGQIVIAKKFNITVGYLPCVKSFNRERQGLTISGALSMALEEINNSTDLLPDVNLLLQWNDTKCDTAVATKLMTDMSSSGVVAFFGPELQCQTEALFAQSRNLPMISYNCYDYQASELSNFARLNPLKNQATKSIISLLRYYRWHKFSVLYEESWEATALTLEKHARQNNMTINHQIRLTDAFTCCEQNMECCETNFWNKLIKKTKNITRIYVFLGSTASLIDMMIAMEKLQLFENGKFMVIFVDMQEYSYKQPMKYLISPEDRAFKRECQMTSSFRKRAQSLLVIASSEPDANYEAFTNKVRKYNSMEPFKFPQPFLAHGKFISYVSIYAAYLYDSMKLYATALHRLIEEETRQKNESLTYEELMSIVTNGFQIVSKMIDTTPMKSILGTTLRLDPHADAEGTFSLLAFKPVTYTDQDINCTHGMIPVGIFQRSTSEFPVYKLNPRLPIDWADNVKPDDDPKCEFLNKNNSKDSSQYIIVLVIGTLVAVLLCALIIFVIFKTIIRRKFFYRRTSASIY